jgi:hypothetical protein
MQVHTASSAPPYCMWCATTTASRLQLQVPPRNHRKPTTLIQHQEPINTANQLQLSSMARAPLLTSPSAVSMSS